MGTASSTALRADPGQHRRGSLGTSDYLLLGSTVLGLAGSAAVGAPCGLRLTTGYYCALCGGTRAVKAIAAGRLLEALQMNTVVTLAVMLAIAGGVAATFVPSSRSFINRVVASLFNLRARSLSLSICLWTVVRNLTVFDLLRPPA